MFPTESAHTSLPKPIEYDEEQKEVLMLFAHLNENQKYAVIEFIKYQFRQSQREGNLSYSPPSFPPTSPKDNGGETA